MGDIKMNEICLKENEMITESQQIDELIEENTFLRALTEELRVKVYKLEKENKQLKSNQEKLVEVNTDFETNNDVLHNGLNENSENNDIGMLNEYENSYYCGCKSEEELKNYEKALNNMTVKK
jgi:predicted nuclease with TOPRIM domain